MSSNSPTPDGNGNGKHGLLASVSNRLIRALPPAMIVLVLLNVVFIGMEMYRTGQRNELLTKIVNSCLPDRSPN